MPGAPDLPEVVGAPVRARLRLSGRSVGAAVAVVTSALLVLRVLSSAGRVLVWVAIAASVAALVTPLMERLARRIPRGLGVALVAIAGLATAGFVTYGLVDGVVEQTEALQRQAPRAAERIERETRFRDAAREVDLSARTRRFVEGVPDRLRGGTPAEAVRSAATRGLAFLAVFVLTLFFLLHGPKLSAAAARQIHDETRRAQATQVAGAVYRRAFGYARGTIAMAVMAAGFAYLLARAAGVPGPVPLALWVLLWDAVPLVGATVGALPIVLLAGASDPTTGVVLLVAFLAYQAAEYVVLQRRLEQRTVRLGPFLTLVGGFAGLELYGLSGALLTILALAVGVVALDESTSP